MLLPTSATADVHLAAQVNTSADAAQVICSGANTTEIGAGIDTVDMSSETEVMEMISSEEQAATTRRAPRPSMSLGNNWTVARFQETCTVGKLLQTTANGNCGYEAIARQLPELLKGATDVRMRLLQYLAKSTLERSNYYLFGLLKFYSVRRASPRFTNLCPVCTQSL